MGEITSILPSHRLETPIECSTPFPKKSECFAISPPTLPPPSELFLLDTMNRLCATREHITSTQKSKIEAFKVQVDAAAKEFAEQLQKTAESTQSYYFWNFLRKVSTSIVSTCSLAFGITLSATPTTAAVGGTLIASGLLSIANLTLTECKAWDWMADNLGIENEWTKNKIKQIAPVACGIVIAGYGLVGSVDALTASAAQLKEQIGSVAQTTLSSVMATVQMGKGLSESGLRQKQAALQLAEDHNQTQQWQFSTHSKEFETLLSHFNHIFKNAQRTVRSISATYQHQG
ncbi:MAG: hypothetical protein RLZZ453_219 [Chlamydiota bacterium]|jgi:hypothetical protein